MLALDGFIAIRRFARNVFLVLLASGLCILVGHFLRQFNIVLNPLAWSSAETISALLSLTIAANVLVRYYGTGNRVSLLLGLTFAITGFIHLAGIFEFYHLLALGERYSTPISWMVGETLLGLLLLISHDLNIHLPWPRDPRKKLFAATAIVVTAACLVTLLFLVFSNQSIHPRSAVPRPWELLPAALFSGAAVILFSMRDRDGFAFDGTLVWVAGLNAAGHLITSQSAHILDMPAGGAELLDIVSYLVLLGATLLDNAHLFRQVRTLAISDSLTGLANYRRLVDILQSELERSGRTNRSFSVLLMDLDGLKRINDKHGHLVGSHALCRVAAILRLNCRSIDTAARYGGDEFALVLPETGDASAQQVAERVRHCLETDGEMPRLTLSVGIATFPQNGTAVQQLLECADRALYQMKGKSKKEKVQKRARSSTP